MNIFNNKTANILAQDGLITIEGNRKDKVEIIGGINEDHPMEVSGRAHVTDDITYMMNDIPIVEGLKESIVAEESFLGRGLSIIKRGNELHVVDANGDVVLKGHKNAKDKLFRCKTTDAMKVGTALVTRRRKDRFSRRSIRKAYEFHENLSHIPPMSTIADNIQHNTWTGLDKDLTPALFRELAKRKDCIICAMSRWGEPQNVGSGVTKYRVGEAVAIDIQGPVTPMSQGCSYWLKVRDIGSGLSECYGVKNKNKIGAEMEAWQTFCWSNGYKPQLIKTDAGSVETGQGFKLEMAKLGMKVHNTPDGEPQKDAERDVQTSLNDLTAVLQHQDTMRASDWLSGIKLGTRIRQRTSNAASREIHPTKSPWEIFTGEKVDMSQLETIGFGDIVVTKTPKSRRKKGVTRNELAKVMEIEMDASRATGLQRIGEEKIERRANPQRVNIDRMRNRESIGQLRHVRCEQNEDGTIIIEAEERIPVNSIDDIIGYQRHRRMVDEIEERKEAEAHVPVDVVEESLVGHETSDSNAANDEMYWQEEAQPMALKMQYWYDRIQRGSIDETLSDIQEKNDEIDHDVIGVAWKSRVIRTDDNPSLNMVHRRTDLQERYRPAMTKEYDGFCEKASVLVTEQEIAENPITGHVTTFTVKVPTMIEKARITVAGNEELRNGIFPDKAVLHAPAMKPGVTFMLMQWQVHVNGEMSKTDFEQAFLQNTMHDAEFERMIIIRLSPYECGKDVCEYRKMTSVGYGCPDASREFYRRLRELFESLGYKVSVVEPSLFIKTLSDGGTIAAGVATDDIHWVNTREEETRKVLKYDKDFMKQKWSMTEGKLDIIIGIDVDETRDVRYPTLMVTLRQQGEILKIRKEFGIEENCPERLTPRPPATRVKQAGYDRMIDREMWQHKLGVIGHIRSTRNDIRPALSESAKMTPRPTEGDLNDLQWTAEYIVTTKNIGIAIHKVSDIANQRKMPIHGAGDCSWATGLHGESYIASMIIAGLYDKNADVHTAPFIVDSGQEKGVLSESASAGELKGTMKTISNAMIGETMMEELAGMTREVNIDGEEQGMTAIEVGVSISKPEVWGELEGPKIEVLLNNRSLHEVLRLPTTKKGKDLRRLGRWINWTKTSITQGIVRVTRVAGKDQKSNPITKTITVEKQHGSEIEWIQGSQPAVDELCELVRIREAKQMGLKEGEKKLGDEMEVEGNSDILASEIERK